MGLRERIKFVKKESKFGTMLKNIKEEYKGNGTLSITDEKFEEIKNLFKTYNIKKQSTQDELRRIKSGTEEFKKVKEEFETSKEAVDDLAEIISFVSFAKAKELGKEEYQK